MTDRIYLERMLVSLKLEKSEIEVQHRIAIAENNAKRDILQRQINAIETQLEIKK